MKRKGMEGGEFLRVSVKQQQQIVNHLLGLLPVCLSHAPLSKRATLIEMKFGEHMEI